VGNRPARALLAFVAAAFVFHQLPALLPHDAGDAVDLLTPFAVAGTAAWALHSLDARGPVVVVAIAAAIAYVDGHGIHLSANSIANEGPGPEVDDLVYFWDERFSHIEAVIGWFGLFACICWAEGQAAARGERVDGESKLIAVTASLLAFTLFTNTVEGHTWPIELAAAAGFVLWLARARERPLLTATAAGFMVGAAVIAAYAIWQGGVPELTDAGLL